MTGRTVEALVTLMKKAITEENTQCGAKHEFTGIVFSETRPARAAEYMKKRVVRLNVKKASNGSGIVDGFAWHAVDEIAGCEESFIPIAKGER